MRDASEDRDRDRVDNGNECREHTNPGVRDTNRNGRPDGSEDADRDRLRNAAEDATGNDPINPDTDGDGVRDGAEDAGRIASFRNDVLTVVLASGDVVKGRVTADTTIDCVGED